jgi:hypothetical protein
MRVSIIVPTLNEKAHIVENIRNLQQLSGEKEIMKLGFICPGVPGHLNPMTTLARQLQARGHDVVFLYSSGACGLPFLQLGSDHFTEGRAERSGMQDLIARFHVGTGH